MLHCVTAFTCFCTFYAIPTFLIICRKFLLFPVSLLFHDAQAAHAKLQPLDIHAGIGPYFCNPGAHQLTPFCASPPERAEKRRPEANQISDKMAGHTCPRMSFEMMHKLTLKLVSYTLLNRQLAVLRGY